MNVCLHSIDKVGDALLLLLKPGGPAAVVVTPSIVLALQKHYTSNFPGKRLVVPSHFNEFFIPKTMEHIAGDIISTKVSVPLSPPLSLLLLLPLSLPLPPPLPLDFCLSIYPSICHLVFKSFLSLFNFPACLDAKQSIFPAFNAPPCSNDCRSILGIKGQSRTRSGNEELARTILNVLV